LNENFSRRREGGPHRPLDVTDAIVITSYEFAARRADEVRLIPWTWSFSMKHTDYGTSTRSPARQRAKALRTALAERFKILLTATPLQNSLMELYGLVSVLDDRFFGDETTFKTMYAGPRAAL